VDGQVINKRQIVLLPFAGGSSQSFQSVVPWLRDHLDLIALDYPGHHLRHDEPLLTTVPQLARDCWSRIQRRLRPGYVILGMSLGALVAFELTVMAEGYQLPPAALVALSAAAPSRVASRHGFATLPEQEFVSALRARYPGELSTMATDPLVRDFVLPVLRADIGAFENYGVQAHGVIGTPIFAIGGTHDSSVSYSDLLAWSDHTTQRVDFKRVAGGHFFLSESGAEVAGDLMVWLDEIGRSPAPNPMHNGAFRTEEEHRS
jgi:surfactin synthase thioesterase subunit